MAVNIQEMQVDVADTTPPSQASQQPKSKAPGSIGTLELRMQLEALTERQLRLKGD